mgnify:CR=1 FL=1
MEILIAIIIGILWSQVISHWGASILLHRYYCHKQFKVPVWFETIGLSMLMVACIRTPIGWIASHRMHHAHSDSENDPHSAKHVGYWRVLFTTWNIPKIPMKYARDLYANKQLVFCHKHWLKILFGLLNTVGHKVDGGADVPWLNFFIAGEGYHRQHHNNFRRVRLHKWDTAGWIAEKLFVIER